MKKILTTVICSLVGINSMLMADSSRPRLVVGIVIDQLRTDYLEYLRKHFGEKGFNLLFEKGVCFRDLEFLPDINDPVSATVVAVTGADPAANGVCGSEVYESTSKTVRPWLSSVGAAGATVYSPENLLLSTISDEIAIDGIGLGAIYSIAVNPQQAIALGGHVATSAVWLDEESGKWATSSWYKDLPSPVALRNRSAAPRSILDTMKWEPLMALDKYPGIPAQKKFYPFRHTFPTSDREAYRRWAVSPLANREVTDIAVDYLRQLKLGERGDAIDMLNLAYTAAPYKYVKDGDYRLELEDTYLRLDQQLESLFKAIDQGPGLDNTLIWVTSTGYYDDATIDDPKYKIPGGEFSKKRALSLLNAFLSARFGNGDYITSFFGPHLSLDSRLIESRKLDPNTVTEAAREFLSKMSGVRAVHTSSDILSESTPRRTELRRMLDMSRSGDLYVEFQSGWNVVDDTRFPVQTNPVRNSMVTTPAFIFGPGLPPTVVNTPVEANRLAPTVTQILRIRSPNGAQGRPLLF